MATATPQRPVRPWRQRPLLFRFLIAVYLLWLVGLMVLYFMTVYPLRHPAHQPNSTTAHVLP